MFVRKNIEVVGIGEKYFLKGGWRIKLNEVKRGGDFSLRLLLE